CQPQPLATLGGFLRQPPIMDGSKAGKPRCLGPQGHAPFRNPRCHYAPVSIPLRASRFLTHSAFKSTCPLMEKKTILTRSVSLCSLSCSLRWANVSPVDG